MKKSYIILILSCIYLFITAKEPKDKKSYYHFQNSALTELYFKTNNHPKESDNVVEDTLIITKKRDNMEIIVYPNPFKQHSTVNFTLEMQDTVTINLYDVEGRLKKSLVASKNMNKGDYVIEFDRANLEGGFYLVQLMSVNGKFAKEVIVVE